MVVRWYVTPCITITDPDGAITHSTTASVMEQHIGSQEVDGVERRLYFTKKKYNAPWSAAYLEADPPYTMALIRSAERVTSHGTQVITTEALDLLPEDYERELTAPEDWAWLASTYPGLLGRFADQPTG